MQCNKILYVSELGIKNQNLCEINLVSFGLGHPVNIMLLQPLLKNFQKCAPLGQTNKKHKYIKNGATWRLVF